MLAHEQYAMISHTVTSCVCVMCCNRDRSWEKREALLELARREKLGLPLIDANFVDPSKIHLPSDEELGDFEIIVQFIDLDSVC